jgi:hypothetical protein
MVQCSSMCSFSFLPNSVWGVKMLISRTYLCSFLAALSAMLLNCYTCLAVYFLFFFTVSLYLEYCSLVSFFVQFQEEGRMKVREALTPQTMQSALQRVIPFPCRNQYTVVILMPKSSCWASVKSMLSWSSNGLSRDAKVWIKHVIYLQHLVLFSRLGKKSSILSLSEAHFLAGSCWHRRCTGLGS